MNETVPKAVRELIELFSTTLSGVKFPECDGAVLAALSTDVERMASELAEAEAECIEAKRRLVMAEEALLQRAGRAHSYARIYAEGDTELLGTIDAIAIPRPKRLVAPAVATVRRRAKSVKSEPLLGVMEQAVPL